LLINICAELPLLKIRTNVSRDLGCDAVEWCGRIPKFRNTVLLPFPVLPHHYTMSQSRTRILVAVKSSDLSSEIYYIIFHAYTLSHHIYHFKLQEMVHKKNCTYFYVLYYITFGVLCFRVPLIKVIKP